ncbi:MAG TPA: MFS transporter [Polyangiales bacterium]|nr:MFS transporter [Polyangiales bacterium]
MTQPLALRRWIVSPIEPATAQRSSPASPLGNAPPGPDFHATEGYKRYVIWLLFAVYVLNFVDRQIMTILIQPIKQEFGFSDTQLGLLGGLAFAVLYSTLGIPIARAADRGSRVSIISISLFVWSIFTALTGFAQSFSQLLMARVAVGIGEAGCTPAAHSLISDYFSKERRPGALSVYSMGIYGGIFVGFIVGGQVAFHYGWRPAFFAVGLPGVLVAIVLKLTLREPPRGYADGLRLTHEPLPLGAAVHAIWSTPSLRHGIMATALHAFVGYGIASFYPAFLMRTQAMSVAEVGYWLALATALGGFIGAYAGGALSERFARRKGDQRHQLWVPAWSTLASVPVGLLVYVLPSKLAVLAAMIFAIGLGAMYLGPTSAITQSLVGVRERAIAAAVALLVINLIGLGLGPLLTGVLSDAFRGYHLKNGLADAAATAEGLRWSLIAMSVVNVWSALHYVLAARTLREDLARIAGRPSGTYPTRTSA